VRRRQAPKNDGCRVVAGAVSSPQEELMAARQTGVIAVSPPQAGAATVDYGAWGGAGLGLPTVLFEWRLSGCRAGSPAQVTNQGRRMNVESLVGTDGAAVEDRHPQGVSDVTVMSILLVVQLAWLALLGYGLLSLIR
jgi:hypothetical protein